MHLHWTLATDPPIQEGPVVPEASGQSALGSQAKPPQPSHPLQPPQPSQASSMLAQQGPVVHEIPAVTTQSTQAGGLPVREELVVYGVPASVSGSQH
ncbi:hypothetical protein V6N11_008792 [Hibiscus sabdariffa]|uniref:Uncharacterized protein n=1 Tax=Hibiscus sabdariffa TaxID=183260 RepID=A0ABR2NR84_9ROSI